MTHINTAHAADIQALLYDLAARFGVVGASLAIWDDGQVSTVATGTANLRTMQPVTPDHLFLIGSTTKVYTATLVMQLVDQGLVELDQPVRRYIPDFRVPDAGATETITVRQLLSHTSGIDNGPYADHGHGDDAVARYVASLAGVPLVFPPGARYSYSNAGLVTAGRIVEAVTGQPWDIALRDRLLQPAGLQHSFTFAEDDIMHPVAVGHIHAGEQIEGSVEAGEEGAVQAPYVVAPRWGVAGRAMGPTGSTLCATAADLARFAALHLNAGRAEDGTQVLSADAVASMQEQQVTLPPGITLADRWCVGWLGADWGGRRTIGHTGHNVGCGSFLRVFPEEHAAFALVFNSGGDADLHHHLFQQLARDLYGIHKPDPWLPIDPPAKLDLSAYAGTYERHQFRLRLETANGGLTAVEASEMAAPLRGQTFRPATPYAFGTGIGDGYQVTPPAGQLTGSTKT